MTVLDLLDVPAVGGDASDAADARASLGGPTVRPGPPPGPGPVPRRIGGFGRSDARLLIGAAASSLSVTLLLFGRLTPLDGRLGFVVVAAVLFVATYAVLTSITEPVPVVVDKVMTVSMTTAALVAMGALATVVVYTIGKGWSALIRPNFYTEDLSTSGPQSPLGEGGVRHAIVGTLVMTTLTLLFTVPLSIACAVYLNESRSRFAGAVRTVVTAMTALPSIIAGLFVFALWILALGRERSGLAASLAISLMMLPIIIRAADVVLRLVPGSLREAAAALGAPQWRVVWHVVLPTARSGLTTSVILGVARGIGETASVLLTAGFTATTTIDPRSDPMVSLPLVAFNLVRTPAEAQITRGFGSAAVLMILVLILFSVARLLGGRPVGQLSRRQARRVAARSARDRARIEGAAASRPAVDAEPPRTVTA